MRDHWPFRTIDGCIVPIPKILPCGDSAVTVEFGDTIDPDINGMVLALDDIVRARAPDGLIETVLAAAKEHQDNVTVVKLERAR